MPIALECRNLVKRYPGQEGPALGDDGDAVSFEVERGELFALLGPSGCGKTTTLRIIGGFVDADRGSVRIDGTDVTRKPAYRRPTNTVFQSYALFPHMRLGANIGFGLKMAGLSRTERDRRVADVLGLVGLPGMERRRVGELSGGQQQRAALARAMANRPSVLLLDEPLGALDLSLRRQMQDELVALKQETATTFVHVTHDQEEACAIADRIAIMDRGKIAQIDTPQELYRSPRTTHVASFLNLGTVVRGEVARSGDVVSLASPDVNVQGPAPSWFSGSSGLAAVLPSDRAVATSALTPGAPNQLEGTLERSVFIGARHELLVRTSRGLSVRASMPTAAYTPAEVGASVVLSWRPEHVLFVADTDQNTV